MEGKSMIELVDGYYIEANRFHFPVRLLADSNKNGEPVYKDCNYKPKFQYWSKSNEIKLLR